MATLTTTAERAVAKMMDGGCSTPLGAFARYAEGTLALRAIWGDVNDSDAALVVASASSKTPIDNLAAAEDLGQRVAALLVQSEAKNCTL